MSPGRRGIPLRTVLVFCFALVVALGVGTFAVQQYFWLTGDLERQDHEQDLALARAVAGGFERYMAQRVRHVEALAAEIGRRGLGDPAALSEMLAIARARDPAFAAFNVADRTGVSVAFAPLVDADGTANVGRRYADRRWFQEAIVRARPSYDVVVGRALGRPAVPVAAPIVSAAGVIGVIVGGLELAGLRQINRDIDPTRSGRLVVVDAAGRVIAHSSPEWEAQARDLSGEDVFQAARQRGQGITEYRSQFSGAQRSAAFVRVPSTGWVVWTSYPIAERQAHLRSLLWGLAGAGLLALGLATGVALVMTRGLTGPIVMLADAARRVAGGRLRDGDPLPVRASRIREFDELLAGFGQMTDALRTQYEDLEAKVAERTRELTLAVRAAEEAAGRLSRQQEIGRGYGELAALLNSLDRSFILDQAARKVAATLHAPIAAIYLTDDGPESLRLKTYAALDAAALDTALLAPAGLPSEVARRQEPILLSAAAREPLRLRTGVGELEVAVVAGYPLVHQQRFMGVLMVAVLEPLTDDTSGFLANAARQLSVALSNAGLFESTRYQSQQMEALNEALRLASTAKSRFLSSMSHELRTPLNAILGFTDILLMSERERLSERQRSALEKVRDSGRHLLDLINQVLDLSKIEAGRTEVTAEPLRLTAVVAECLAAVEPEAAAHALALRAVGLESVPEMVQDRQKVKQILLNLLSNAVKFTRAGSVEVRVAAEPGDVVSVAVADTGPGIRAADLARLFEEFLRLAPVEGEPTIGTGLGLAIARRLAELLGGSLTAASEVGQGSVFTLRLPARFAGSRPPAPVLAAGGPLAPGTERVLVIDDDRDAVEIVRTALADEPVAVDWAADAASGRARARAPRPAVIILDVMLQGVADGWDILSELKADPVTRGIPVILHSVIDNPERARRLGADEVLAKPAPLGAIRAAVRRLLARTPTGAGSGVS